MKVNNVFRASGRTEKLPLEVEQTLILRIRNGSDEALLELLPQYGAMLRSAVRTQGKFMASWDDAEAVALVAFVEAVHGCGDNRVALVLKNYILRAFEAERASLHSVQIPARALQRYRAVMTAACGDLAEAYRLAPDFHMEPTTWLAVHAVLTGIEDVDADAEVILSALWSEESDDYVQGLAQVALNVLNSEERDVVRCTYGFDDYRPQTERVAAERFGITVGSVRRLQKDSMSKMRAALGADVQKG